MFIKYCPPPCSKTPLISEMCIYITNNPCKWGLGTRGGGDVLLTNKRPVICDVIQIRERNSFCYILCCHLYRDSDKKAVTLQVIGRIVKQFQPTFTDGVCLLSVCLTLTLLLTFMFTFWKLLYNLALPSVFVCSSFSHHSFYPLE